MSQRVVKRKRKKKATKKITGRVRMTKEQQKRRAAVTFSQTEIGEYLGVDRSTVARWCREGLPCERNAHGKEHQIVMGIALHWLIGHRHAKKNKLDLSPLEKILHALAMLEVRLEKYPSFDRWKAEMLDTIARDWIDVDRDEILFAIGRLTGLRNGLPFK